MVPEAGYRTCGTRLLSLKGTDAALRSHQVLPADRSRPACRGLALDIYGPGISSAREPFELNPLRLVSELERFAEWSVELETSLFPVRLLDHGRFLLGISEKSEIFLVEAWVATFGIGDAGLENLILGVLPKTVAE
ncbi:SUKH-3 domain-containing protein [Amycolatopsis sp. NBC_00355]|uniref:SUKH-3 domain-containing protein n=1 Tax=Amycolatopsis sp. NBC_00355 TaxID=2975957 RepID=UPI002E263683